MKNVNKMRLVIDKLGNDINSHKISNNDFNFDRLCFRTDLYHEVQARRILRLAGTSSIEKLYNLAVERRLRHAEQFREAKLFLNSANSGNSSKHNAKQLECKCIVEKGFNFFYTLQVESLARALELSVKAA